MCGIATPIGWHGSTLPTGMAESGSGRVVRPLKRLHLWVLRVVAENKEPEAAEGKALAGGSGARMPGTGPRLS